MNHWNISSKLAKDELETIVYFRKTSIDTLDEIEELNGNIKVKRGNRNGPLQSEKKTFREY